MGATYGFILGGILLILSALSALFSSIETALFSLQPSQIRHLKKKNPALGEALERLTEYPRRLLSVILLADAVVNLPLIILSVYLLREVVPSTVPFWIQALVIFTLIVFICDLVPKLVALRAPYRVSKIGVAVVGRLIPVCEPACRLLQNGSEKIADFLTPKTFKPNTFLSEEELETLVQLSAEEGTLHTAESEMITEIIKLGDKTAKDCMTPRIDAFAVSDDLGNEQLIPQLKAKRYRRVPVYGETPDDILGVLDVKKFLENPDVPYTEIVDPPSFVPETMKALDLLKSFLGHPQGMAIVVDEFGGTEGIVTMADIVEEILSDALPTANRELYIENCGDGKLIVNGNVRLDDLSEHLKEEIMEEGVDTIGGLIFHRLGYLPKPGAEILVDKVLLTVRRTSRKRVEELMVSPVIPEDGREDAP